MKVSKVMYFLLVSLFSTISITGQIKDDTYYSDMAKALGYYYSIKIGLEDIGVKFPVLKNKATLAKLEFDISHLKAVENIEIELSQYLNIDKNKFSNDLIDKGRMLYPTDNVNIIDAEKSLETFKEERIIAKNNDYSTYIQTLLRHNPKFKFLPSQEFLDNYRSLLDSNCSPKSKGLHFSIEYPKSWSSRDGKRPNIIQVLKSYDNRCILGLATYDLKELINVDSNTISSFEFDKKISNEMIEDSFYEFFDYEYGLLYFEEQRFQNISDYKHQKLFLDGQPTIMFSGIGTTNNGLLEQKAKTINYFVQYQKYIICLSFMIVNREEDDLNVWVQKYDILTQLVANSLIVVDKYKAK
jgi:hypothetical protein